MGACVPVPARPVATENDVERVRAKALASLEPMRIILRKSNSPEEILQALQTVINHTEYLTCLQAERIQTTKQNRKRR